MILKDKMIIVQRFDAARARQNAIRIWQAARQMDTPAVFRAAEVAADLLRRAGIENAQVEKLPADGATSVNGWILPIAWTLRDARLEIAGRGEAGQVLADTAVNPQMIALYSPATPGGQWVEGEVISAPEPLNLGRRLRGRFLLLASGKGSFDINAHAARHGALGILAAHEGPIAPDVGYLNYSVPPDATRPCVPVFSLTSESGRRLRERLAADPRLRLRARVRAVREAGHMPMVTGSIGSGGPEVFVCAHIDEIGAQDNASGCGVAIEALRILQALSTSEPGAPQRRAIRFFFSVEVRGVQAWLANQPRVPNFLAGLNLDMVGVAPTPEAGKMMVLTGYQHRPHFAAHLIRDAAAMADRVVGGMTRGEKHNHVGDGVFGIAPPGGTVALEQKTNPTYHTSADTAATLCDRSLRWTGVAALAFLHRLSRLDNAEVLRLARRIHDGALAAAPTPAAAAALQRAQGELASLRRAYSTPNLYPPYTTPAEFYRAGVRLSTGCWPDVERGLELDRLIRGLAQRRGAKAKSPLSGGAEARARRAAEAMVPLALARGFLSFEDHVTGRQRAVLKSRTGLEPSWGVPSWAWMTMSNMTGKQTLAQIVDDLRAIGMAIDCAQAVRLTHYLADIGRVRLRPVLGAGDIRRVLRAVGVKRGMILTVHASLSAFGYVRGGAAVLIQALRDVLGPRGTLCMPTHSNSVLGAPPYDPACSRSNTGAVTEFFRTLPGVRRSAHPTHSVAALGPAAAALIGAVRPDQAPLARDGFWGQLVDRGGHVLLMCPVKSTTIFHVGETWLDLPQPPLVAHALDATGRRRVYVLPHAPWHVDHFEEALAAPLIRQRVMREVRLGDSTIRFAPARVMADISVEANRHDPFVSLGKKGRCACHFCNTLRTGITCR